MFDLMNRFRRFATRSFLAVLVAVALVAPAFGEAAAPAGLPSEQAASTQAIRDLYKQYELWEKTGIKFVVRDENGRFVTWGVGRLESWDGTRTVVCVRNPKGAFLTWAKGRIETWKNDTKRYVFRDKRGHFLQWAPLDLTSAGTFGDNLDRLFTLSPKDSKHFGLLVEIIHESIVTDLEAGRTDRAFRFASVAFKHAADPKQREKITMVLKPVLAWLKPALLHAPADAELAELQATCHDLLQMSM